VFAKACELGREGIVSKRDKSGRSRNWMKIRTRISPERDDAHLDRPTAFETNSPGAKVGDLVWLDCLSSRR
jgi:hypothetical protein